MDIEQNIEVRIPLMNVNSQKSKLDEEENLDWQCSLLVLGIPVPTSMKKGGSVRYKAI